MPAAHQSCGVALRRHQAPVSRAWQERRRSGGEGDPSTRPPRRLLRGPCRRGRHDEHRVAHRRPAVRGGNRESGRHGEHDRASRLPAPARRSLGKPLGPEPAAAASEHHLHSYRRSALGYDGRHALARRRDAGDAGTAQRARRVGCRVHRGVHDDTALLPKPLEHSSRPVREHHARLHQRRRKRRRRRFRASRGRDRGHAARGRRLPNGLLRQVHERLQPAVGRLDAHPRWAGRCGADSAMFATSTTT